MRAKFEKWVGEKKTRIDLYKACTVIISRVYIRGRDKLRGVEIDGACRAYMYMYKFVR